MKRIHKTLALLAVLLSCPALQAEPGVVVEGQVKSPGRYLLDGETRLFQVVGPAGVEPDAYLAGAAWLHRPYSEAQRKLKAGVLFDLAVLARHARLGERPELAALAERLRVQVAALPVTGRRVQDLDPVVLELERGANRPLADGDILLYPSRPSGVRVVGAVREDCLLEFAALQPARRYLNGCERAPAADRDWLYVIQPDGRVQRQGIGLWNRTSDPLPLPGATLLVPLEQRLLQDVAEELNDDLAAFLATQPLPMEHPSR
ncbi:capsule biosynthesis GfcC family protein [Pseudomonas stutzeri]|nr:capsule biosynthesis GfcC family protein [Stutzerimonas stutzeri]